MGLWWADAVAGLIVTVFIVHVGWEVTSELLSHLMDGVDPEVIDQAEAAAVGVPGRCPCPHSGPMDGPVPPR